VGHFAFFLLFGTLHTVLQYGLHKKLQCSSFVPFAPGLFFLLLLRICFLYERLKEQKLLCLELQLYRAELGTEGPNLFYYQDAGLP